MDVAKLMQDREQTPITRGLLSALLARGQSDMDGQEQEGTYGDSPRVVGALAPMVGGGPGSPMPTPGGPGLMSGEGTKANIDGWTGGAGGGERKPTPNLSQMADRLRSIMGMRRPNVG